MKKNISLFSFGLISLLLWKPVYAFDVKTHKAINKTIATGTFNSFSLDGYLKTNLGISEGVEATFKDMDSTSNKVYDWIKLGGEYEDVPYWYMPYLRSVNHFHNPLTDAGYSGFWGDRNYVRHVLYSMGLATSEHPEPRRLLLLV